MAVSPTQSTGQPWSPRQLGALRAQLMRACALHASGLLLLVYAAVHGFMRWGSVAMLAAASLVSYGVLAWVQRHGRPQHRFDPSLFGPWSWLGAATLIWVGCQVDEMQRSVLMVALLPVQMAVASRARGRLMRHLFGPACWLIGAALLVWDFAAKPGVWALAGVATAMLAAALVLRARRNLRCLTARAALLWVVSEDKTQSVFIGRFLVGAVNAVAGIVALNYGVYAGVIDPVPTFGFTVAAIVSTVGMYLAQRTGWSKRLADPGMTEPQLVVMISYVAGGYYLSSIGSGVALMLLVTVQVFGMFAISPLQVARTSVVATVLMGAAMLAVALQADDVHLKQLQAVHFAVMVVILISVSWLAHQLARLRGALVKRKNDLTEALARIEILASRDELTGLFNRRRMQELLQNQIHLHARDPRPFCLAVVDMDHFKRVNDQYGHGVGDELLRAFAESIQKSLRDTDAVARWGGEEFLVLLVDVPAQEAVASLERARQAFSSVALLSVRPELRATFSCGLTEYRAGEGIEHTIDRADQALYRAKAAGRNRTEVMVHGAKPAPLAHAAAPMAPALEVSV